MATWEGFSDRELRTLKKDSKPKQKPQVRQSARFSNDRPAKKTTPRPVVPHGVTHRVCTPPAAEIKDTVPEDDVVNEGSVGATNEVSTVAESKSIELQPLPKDPTEREESSCAAVKELEISTDM